MENRKKRRAVSQRAGAVRLKMVVGRFGADGTRVCVTTLTAQELKRAADPVLTLLLRVVAGNRTLTKLLLT